MPVDLSFRGRSVLLLGAGSESAGVASALLRDGATVSVESDAGSGLPTSLRDLAERGLVALTTHADQAAYDIVIRAASLPRPDPSPVRGCVTLLGGGPGDPGLLTVAGLEAIRAADVIVHDRLAPLDALVHARPDAEIIDVGKIPRGDFTPQERINVVLLERARCGRNVLRFKGGDSFVFGRGGEEAQACAEAGIPVRVIPGVSASIAAPALAGIPLTHRSLVQGFTVVSGHVPPGDPRSTLDWGSIARSGTTMVILMGVATLRAITAELLAQGLDAGTPAAVVSDAGLPSMRVARASVVDIAEVAAREGLGAPAVAIVGAVAALDVLA